MKDIIQVLTFFRGFDFIWKSLPCHKMCSQKSLDENCFYCHMRSSMIRLSASRGRGPKSLKLIEFTSQLKQYQSLLGWNWRENMVDLPSFVENTLKLLCKHERRTSDLFGVPELKCLKCKQVRKLEDQLVYHIDTSIIQSDSKEVNLKSLMDPLIKTSNMNNCCLENSELI